MKTGIKRKRECQYFIEVLREASSQWGISKYIIDNINRNIRILILEGSCILMLLVIFILPFFSFPGNSIIRNTLSQLGARNTPNAWIMNISFVFLGIASVLSGWKYYRGFEFQRIFLVIFGLSLASIAFFNQAPVNDLSQIKTTEDGWHSYFSFANIMTFVILSLSTAFICENSTTRLLDIGAGMSVIFLSVLMSLADMSAGVWHRLIYIITMGWMIYHFNLRAL